jgi:hypothetical protein
MSTLTPAQLTAWIDDRRDRLDRGELADVGPLLIEPFYEVADLERWVRLTLRDIDRWQASDAGFKALYYKGAPAHGAPPAGAPQAAQRPTGHCGRDRTGPGVAGEQRRVLSIWSARCAWRGLSRPVPASR